LHTSFVTNFRFVGLGLRVVQGIAIDVVNL
jgi:hypothetical protein